MKITNIVTDMMGATTLISKIPESQADFAKNGAEYLKNSPSEKALISLDEIRAESGLTTPEEIVEYAVNEIAKRNLQPHYMTLAGEVTVDGYKQGRMQGHAYADIPEAFGNWKKTDKGVFIYSSGSEESQEWNFRTTQLGDLTSLIDGYFDTAKVGSKKEADSYKRIADIIEASPKEMLFISDSLVELNAADKAGCPVVLTIRPENKPVGEHNYKVVEKYTEI